MVVNCSSFSISSSTVPLGSTFPSSTLSLTRRREAAFKTSKHHPELTVDSETVVIAFKSCSKNCCQLLHDSSDIHCLNFGIFSGRFAESNLDKFGTENIGLSSGRC